LLRDAKHVEVQIFGDGKGEFCLSVCVTAPRSAAIKK
jgi:acetyl/propionyl-CoA carboxylase alpha subunit